MSSETLYTCPFCHRSGFMLSGLKAHRCDAKNKRRETPTGPLVRQRLTCGEIARAINAQSSTKP